MKASPAPVHVNALSLSEGVEWDRFVRSRPESTFCHLWGWRSIMEDVLGHETRYLLARDGTHRVTGALPLVRVRSRLFGDYLVSMPFLNYGGPIGEPEAVAALTEHAVALAADWSVDLLELRSREPLPGDLHTSDRKITVLLDLPDESETLWKAFPSKVRSQVRRPMKEGMTFRQELNEIRSFYSVFKRHMRDLGTPVLPMPFFLRSLHLFEEDILFGAVYHEGQAVAAGAGFMHGDEFEITWASSLREYNRMSPNMLLYWGLMQKAIERGAKVFNFGRCTPGGGTHRFKKQWGGRDVPLPWGQWSPTGVTATPSPDSAKFRLATQIWQKLPLAVTDRLGPVLAKRIP